MHRFFLAPEHCHQATLTLRGGEAHHATRVLRVQAGDMVVVLDGAGGEFLCEVGKSDKHEVVLHVQRRKLHPPPPFALTLLVAIPKAKLIESIIEKATELGAQRVVPLMTQRVAIRLDQVGAHEKGEKWQQVAVEAIKQCGAAWLPRVEPPSRLAEVLARSEHYDLGLVGALQGDSLHPAQYFKAFAEEHGRNPDSVAVWIGPEGDFAAEELLAIQRAGAKPITLGPLVLRVETAAIYSLAFLNYELRRP